MKIKTTLKEMKDAEVFFISLVTRGANRIPFRTVKSDQEHGMINLGNLGKVLKGTSDRSKKSEAPQVVAVVVGTHDESTMESIQKALTDSGLTLDKVSKNEDGTVVLSAGDLDMKEATIVRLSEDMALVLKGFSAYSDTLSQSGNFSDVVAAQGYFPGLRTACDAAMSTISNLLYKADSGPDAAAKVSGVLSQFSTYVTAMTQGLPAVAFKAELAVDEVLKSAKMKGKMKDKMKDKGDDMGAPEGVDPKKWAEMSDDDKKAWKAKAKKEGEGTETPPADTSDADAAKDAADAAVAEAVKAAAAKAEESDAALKTVLAQLSALSEAISGVSGEVAKVAKSQTELSARVDEVARKAETASHAVKSTVVAGAVAGDEPAQTKQVQKSDDDPRTGAFDTAFIRRQR